MSKTWFEMYNDYFFATPKPAPKSIGERAAHCVFAILDDLMSRGGLHSVWDTIDRNTQEEILEEWHHRVLSVLQRNTTDA